MADNLKTRGPRDGKRINVNERWELNYWAKKLGVTPLRLRNSVKRVGTMAGNVRRDLESRM